MADDTKFVDGAAKLSRRIKTIRERLSVPALVPEIGELLLRRTLDRFDREVTPDGQPWKQLADSTLKRRGYLIGIGKKMLVREGDLRASIQIIKGGYGSTFTNTGAGLRIGIDGNARSKEGKSIAKYGAIQNITRQFLGIGRLDIKAVDGFLRRQAERVIDES